MIEIQAAQNFDNRTFEQSGGLPSAADNPFSEIYKTMSSRPEKNNSPEISSNAVITSNPEIGRNSLISSNPERDRISEQNRRYPPESEKRCAALVAGLGMFPTGMGGLYAGLVAGAEVGAFLGGPAGALPGGFIGMGLGTVTGAGLAVYAGEKVCGWLQDEVDLADRQNSYRSL